MSWEKVEKCHFMREIGDNLGEELTNHVLNQRKRGVGKCDVFGMFWHRICISKVCVRGHVCKHEGLAVKIDQISHPSEIVVHLTSYSHPIW